MVRMESGHYENYLKFARRNNVLENLDGEAFQGLRDEEDTFETVATILFELKNNFTILFFLESNNIKK